MDIYCGFEDAGSEGCIPVSARATYANRFQTDVFVSTGFIKFPTEFFPTFRISNGCIFKISNGLFNSHRVQTGGRLLWKRSRTGFGKSPEVLVWVLLLRRRKMGGDCGERDTQDTLVLLGYAKRFASQRAYCDEASSMREAKGFYKKIKNKNK